VSAFASKMLTYSYMFCFFDFLEKEREIPIKKMSGLFRLKQFVIHDVRNLSQFEFFLIDLKALKDAENEIIEAATAFSTMHNARTILFAEGLDGSSPLISKLIDLGFYNIITSTDYEDIKEEMLACISPEGKDIRSAIRSKYFPQEEIRQKDKADFAFLCRDVKIAVVGAAHKVGTTATAFNLVNFLVKSGADAAYVEANTNGHLSTLPTYYKEMTVSETHVEYNGVKYYFRGHFPEENNFIVIDFGTLAQCSLKVLKQCELLILCGTTKPYELDFVRAAFVELHGMPLCLLLSYTPKNVQSEISKMLKNKNVQLYFTDYSPDLFDGKANAKVFTEIVKGYMHVKAIE
jgi:hypothetical protein